KTAAREGVSPPSGIPAKASAQQAQTRNHPTQQQSHVVERNSATATPLMLFDHPLQRLLPPHVAVALDRSAVAKICHYCLKDFPDEMAVLKHQVSSHQLDEASGENSEKSNEQMLTS
uniref:C2H2-type domain-containing protein n=1 Tax=Mesocestoides corti TaxID=53468 RepID=A0A5K3FUK2_MESCO